MLKLDYHVGLIRIRNMEIIYTMSAYGDDKQFLNIEGTRNDMSTFQNQIVRSSQFDETYTGPTLHQRELIKQVSMTCSLRSHRHFETSRKSYEEQHCFCSRQCHPLNSCCHIPVTMQLCKAVYATPWNPSALKEIYSFPLQRVKLLHLPHPLSVISTQRKLSPSSCVVVSLTVSLEHLAPST